MEPREEFWKRWSPWRHGAAGQGNFADVMRVLRLYETFSDFAASHAPRPEEGVTVVDLGCGAVPMAGPLTQALAARGTRVRRYVGVDFADRDWMPARVAEELSRAGLSDRASYVHHDLAGGLPALELERRGALLIASCWGITYLPVERLTALLKQCAALGAQWPGGAVLYVNLMSAGEFDRDVLTRKFLGEVVPGHVWRAARTFDRAPLTHLRLAMRALPRMREFGAEVKHVATLMPDRVFVEALRGAGLEPSARDATALWGQTTSYAVKLG